MGACQSCLGCGEASVTLSPFGSPTEWYIIIASVKFVFDNYYFNFFIICSRISFRNRHPKSTSEIGTHNIFPVSFSETKDLDPN